MRATGNVSEGLVDGDALDGRREVAQDSDGRVAEPLVFVEMPADKNEVGTELPRASSGHAASHAEDSRFVRGREHDAAADRNRLAAQARVEQLFDRRIKGVEIRVENGGYSTHLVDSSPWTNPRSSLELVTPTASDSANGVGSGDIVRVFMVATITNSSELRVRPTTAQTRVATYRVAVRLPGASPLERQLRSSASAPSSIPASDRRR